MRWPAAACAAALLAGCSGTHAVYDEPGLGEVAPDWKPVDASTGQIVDSAGLKALAEAFPDSGSVRLRLLSSQLRGDDAAAAMQSLQWLAERGYVFGEGGRTQIAGLLGEEATQYLLPDAQPVTASTVYAVVPPEAHLLESAVVSQSKGRVVASSVMGKSLWRMDQRGEWQEFPVAEAENLSGLAFDEAARSIWAASGVIDGRDRQTGSGAVLFWDGKGDRPVVYPAPDGVQLSDMVRAEDGTLYASDPLGGGVYVLTAGAQALQALVAPGVLRSPQGLAVSRDGTLLYVSDYRYGLAAVSRDTGKVMRVTAQVPILLDGIDGLWRHGNSLIAMQNGTSPMTVSRLVLSDDGLSIVAREVLEQAHPDWTEPLSGTISASEDHGTALFYIGNGQWDVFNPDGSVKEGKEPAPTQIRRLPLD